MAKQPLSLPPGLFIFNKLTCHGFWMSTWAQDKGKDRSSLIMEIVKLVEQGKVRVGSPIACAELISAIA
jgi:mitochondrial enoyl-[acyl-carrier protein] reductase / trans-2-enoyl-CoA reductase